ncbi:T9SS type A sorting domain-containing protein [bacterium]|nr:T9SS type A sorting domain-containing protein [bacterium]
MKQFLVILMLLISVNAGLCELITLQGTITDDMTLTPDNEYLLRGGVFIGNGENETILTIEPGTHVYGEQATDGMLVIAQYSRIMAEGTADAPIVFTSDQEEGEQDRADWGGVIINGLAPLNIGGNGQAEGEGDTGTYGGDDPHDNSGTMRYCRIEFAGREISPDNELNGLALQGVGDGTVIEYLQVHMNKDDGIEFFGGTVNAKYIYITGAADDSFDWTDGWQGMGQFWVAQQYGDDADQGIEADNNAEENDATPRSNPQIYNVTLVGDRFGSESDIGMLLREGTGATIQNAIIMGFGDCGIDLDHEATFNNAWTNNSLNGNLVVNHAIVYDNKEPFQTGETDEDDEANYAFTTGEFLTMYNMHNRCFDPQLRDPYNKVEPDFTPRGGAPALKGYTQPPDNDFFEQVNFVGGVGPDNNWLEGWTRSCEPENTEPGFAVLEGVIQEDMTLTADNEYLLRGGVFVGDANHHITLTIEPGTTIYGEQATDGMLVIARGSKINANGSPYFPIVFTSDQIDGEQDRADWGGVIINGGAPLNTGAEAEGEGDTGPYGGNNPHDDSGCMRYCRIEFAGREISPDNELNGLALQGVGDATIIDYIQVHMNKDDGIEFFGGTVNAKHIYITGAADDSFDWTDGWHGMGQFWVAQQYGDDADQGFECDNNGEENDATPRSNPKVYNVTIVGDRDGAESDIGMLLREGTGAEIKNAIVMNFGDCGIDIDHEATFNNAWTGGHLNGNLVVDNSIFYHNVETAQTGETDEDDENNYVFTTSEFITELNQHNRFVDPRLFDPIRHDMPNFSPAGNSPALYGFAEVPDNEFFDAVNFVGAVGPDYNWLIGWTRPGTHEMSAPELDAPVPNEYRISSVYPNPFNPTVSIAFDIPEQSEIVLNVFDMNGRLVEQLNQGDFKAGQHHISWDAQNQPAGIYLFQLKAGNTVMITKAALIK